MANHQLKLVRDGVTDVKHEESLKKNQILNAAAELFASLEFHGTSLRMIAEKANVSQSLIHYHYMSKEQLFDEVFKRYVLQVNKERAALLNKFLKNDSKNSHKSLEELILIIIGPWIKIIRSSDSRTREFARFVIRCAYHQDDWSLKVAADHYSELSKLTVEAFRMLFPDFTEDDALRAYYFTLSMFFMPLSAPERLNKVSGRKVDMADPDKLLLYGIRYAAAGIRAMRQ